MNHDQLVHAEELAAASATGGDVSRVFEVVCEDAFNAYIDGILSMVLAPDELRDAVRAVKSIALQSGVLLDDRQAVDAAMRGQIGGAISMGIATGLEIARARGWNPEGVAV